MKSKAKKQTNKSSKNKKALDFQLATILALFAFFLYSNTLNHGYALDDSMVVEKNYIVQKGISAISTIWSTHYTEGFENGVRESYRPMSLTMLAIEWSLSPNNPKLYHWVQVLLYALTGCLLFFTIKKIIPHPQKQLFAFLATAIYLVLPVHTEVVANIKSRDEVLAFLFLIIALNALWTYLDKKKIIYWGVSVLAYTVAIFSKESALTFLAIFPLTIWFFRDLPLKKILWTVLPFLLPIIAYFLLRDTTVNIGDGEASALAKVAGNETFFSSNYDKTNSFGNFLKTTFIVLFKYIRLLIWPDFLNAHAFYVRYAPTSWLNLEVILGMILYMTFSIWTLINWTKKHLLAYSWAFYTLTLSLTAYLLIVTAESYIERFLYTPSLGFTLATSYGIIRITQPYFRTKKAENLGFWRKYSAPLMITGGIALIFSAMTINRNQAWQSTLTLCEADLVDLPNCGQLQFTYGVETLKAGMAAKNPNEQKNWLVTSEKALKKMLNLNPNHGVTNAQLGLLYYQRGNQTAALDEYLKAIELSPNYAMSYNNAGMIYYLQGDVEKAEAMYQKAVAVNPKYVDGLRNFGGIKMLKKEYVKAAEQYETAIHYQPNNADLLYFLGSAYVKIGRQKEGESLINKAIAMDNTLKGLTF
ncbi:MAG: tetratricopeptide repeat protein [Bacteroidota bacterium]